MLVSELNINSNNNSKQTKSNKILYKKNDLSASFLTKKFVNTYNLKDFNLNATKHLKKIFLHFLKFQIVEIILYKTLNNDNSIRLEFKAITIYTKKSNIKYKKKSKPISTISISKFFRDNYKYIIV